MSLKISLLLLDKPDQMVLTKSLFLKTIVTENWFPVSFSFLSPSSQYVCENLFLQSSTKCRSVQLYPPESLGRQFGDHFVKLSKILLQWFSTGLLYALTFYYYLSQNRCFQLVRKFSKYIGKFWQGISLPGHLIISFLWYIKSNGVIDTRVFSKFCGK